MARTGGQCADTCEIGRTRYVCVRGRRRGEGSERSGRPGCSGRGRIGAEKACEAGEETGAAVGETTGEARKAARGALGASQGASGARWRCQRRRAGEPLRRRNALERGRARGNSSAAPEQAVDERARRRRFEWGTDNPSDKPPRAVRAERCLFGLLRCRHAYGRSAAALKPSDAHGGRGPMGSLGGGGDSERACAHGGDRAKAGGSEETDAGIMGRRVTS